MSYETLRHFADSYGLAALATVWLGFAAWPFRPGARDRNRAAANMIFEDEDDG